MSRTLLVANPDMVCTRADHTGATFWDPANGTEVSLGPALAALVRKFAVPTDMASIAGAGPAVASAVAELVQRQVLVAHRRGDTPATGHGGLFRSPVMTLAEALRGDVADVVVVGMPYDAGVSHRPGTRFAPSYLRRVSGALLQYDNRSAVPQGHYDPVGGGRVLAGVRVADIGDLTATVHTRNGETFDALERTIQAIAGAGRVPVMLGGDHSTSLPAVRGVLAAVGRLGVIHIDAHADYSHPRADDWRVECHHGNFMNWLVGDERVSLVAQFGVRQLESVAPQRSPKVVVWPGVSATRVDVDSILRALPTDLPYYVTIDVDGLDPAVMPATGTPLPGGFSHQQLTQLLVGLCAARRIVGIDMVELLPDSSEVPGLIACDLLLRTMNAAVRGAEVPHREGEAHRHVG